MSIAETISLFGVLIALITLVIQQSRIFRLDKQSRNRTEIKFKIFNRLQNGASSEQELFSSLGNASPYVTYGEVRSALYEMLVEDTVKYLAENNTFSVSKDTDQEVLTELEFRRNDKAFSILDEWQSEKFRDARDLIREIKKNPDLFNDEIIKKKIENGKDNPELERSVITLLNYFQIMFLAIQSKQVNEIILRQAFQETYRFVHKYCFPWFETRNSNDPNMCNDLVALYNRWYQKP